MDIRSDEMSSAIFAGFSTERFVEGFMGAINGLIIGAADLLQGVNKWLSKNLPGWDFFRKWFADDPVGATAGALLGVVLLVVGGKLIAAAAGGIKALWAAGLGGKIATIFGGLTVGWLLSKAIQFGVRGAAFVWNFNWQVPDSSLKEMQESLLTGLFGQLGATAGSAVGSFCGFGAVTLSKKLKAIKLNPEIMARLDEISKGPFWGEDPPELADELIQNVKALVILARNTAAQWMFIESFKNARKWIKNRVYQSWLEVIFPRFGEMIAAWGDEENEAWSFAFALETWIESFPSVKLRLFTEEFFDALMDTCSETLMIVSHALA